MLGIVFEYSREDEDYGPDTGRKPKMSLPAVESYLPCPRRSFIEGHAPFLLYLQRS